MLTVWFFHAKNDWGELGSFLNDQCVEGGPRQIVLGIVSSKGVLARWHVIRSPGGQDTCGVSQGY